MSWKQSEMVHVRTNTFHSICKLQQRERQISTFWMAILLMLHCSWAGVEVISQNKRSSWWFQILRNVLPSEIASSEDMYLQLIWKHGQGEISKDSIFDVNPAPLNPAPLGYGWIPFYSTDTTLGHTGFLVNWIPIWTVTGWTVQWWDHLTDNSNVPQWAWCMQLDFSQS